MLKMYIKLGCLSTIAKRWCKLGEICNLISPHSSVDDLNGEITVLSSSLTSGHSPHKGVAYVYVVYPLSVPSVLKTTVTGVNHIWQIVDILGIFQHSIV